jgi:hypothetical protein
MVFPAAAFPSTVTLNTFSSFVADFVGWNSNVNFFHSLETPFTDFDAKTVPRVDFSDEVIVPVNLSDLAQKDPLYVQPSWTLMPCFSGQPGFCSMTM